MKLTITRGLPASGKTTLSRAQPGYPISLDEFRRMLFGGWTGKEEHERAVVAAQHAAITALLKLGLDVFVHDSNLPQRSARGLRRLADLAGAEFEVVDLTGVPLEECLARNENRAGTPEYVPPAVIREKWTRFVEPLNGQPMPFPVDPPGESVEVVPYVPQVGAAELVMVDLDGTVALMGTRSPFDETRVHDDRPNRAVIAAVRAMYRAGHEVIFCSARTEACRTATQVWLEEHIGIPYVQLLMREVGDTRKDAVVKRELFDRHVRKYWDVVAVFDDRSQVVQMWRSLGLTVFQVADGDF